MTARRLPLVAFSGSLAEVPASEHTRQHSEGPRSTAPAFMTARAPRHPRRRTYSARRRGAAFRLARGGCVGREARRSAINLGQTPALLVARYFRHRAEEQFDARLGPSVTAREPRPHVSSNAAAVMPVASARTRPRETSASSAAAVTTSSVAACTRRTCSSGAGSVAKRLRFPDLRSISTRCWRPMQQFARTIKECVPSHTGASSAARPTLSPPTRTGSPSPAKAGWDSTSRAWAMFTSLTRRPSKIAIGARRVTS